MSTIFWPIDVKHGGFCYGWVQPVICIAGVIHGDSESQAETLLQSINASHQWLPFKELCGTNPLILGRCWFGRDSDCHHLPQPSLELFLRMNDPNHDIIYYYRHKPQSLRFYSIDTLPFDAAVGAQDENRTSKHRTLARHKFSRAEPRTEFNFVVINQFNSSKTLESLIQTKISEQNDSLSSHFHPVPRSMYHSNYVVRCFATVSALLCFICRTVSMLCNTALPVLSLPLAPHLKEISATIQQVEVRADQVDFLVHQYHSLRRHNAIPIAEYSVQYIKFYNALWLIFNDIIVGAAFGSFLCENHLALSTMLQSSVESILINWVQWALLWLNNWPAGLKLNTELSQFYSHTFIDIVITWGNVLRIGVPYLPSVIYTIGILSSSGMTSAISLLSDLLGLITAHIHLCYFISMAVYHKQLKMAGSLWNLFRGKRYNVLRNRIDPWDYDIDQLLFGTMLFTLLAFLFPTVLAYYALFAMLRLVTILIQACMETLLAFMNHFPLFLLMQKVKDPWRIPGGVYFATSTATPTSYPVLVVKNQSVPLSAIFSQYISLWSRLSSHYNPVRLLRCMLSGEYLAAIPNYYIYYHSVAQRDHTVR